MLFHPIGRCLWRQFRLLYQRRRQRRDRCLKPGAWPRFRRQIAGKEESRRGQVC